jgi:hypothetical protein
LRIKVTCMEVRVALLPENAFRKQLAGNNIAGNKVEIACDKRGGLGQLRDLSGAAKQSVGENFTICTGRRD